MMLIRAKTRTRTNGKDNAQNRSGTFKRFLTRKSSGGHQAKSRKEEKPKPEEKELD
jgi:hypothetical protein